jgi:hypothetical protein
LKSVGETVAKFAPEIPPESPKKSERQLALRPDTENNREKPENLKTNLQECTPEQIEECHFDAEQRPCDEEQDQE